MAKKKPMHSPDAVAPSSVQSPSSQPSVPSIAPRHDGGGFASLAGVAALILAALQVIPAYVPRDMWTYVIIGVCILGLATYVFAKLRLSPSPERTRYFAFLSLLFAVACFSGFQIYSLRQETAKLRSDAAGLKEKLNLQMGSKPLQDFLNAVVKEGDDRWDGEFERRYARPTLYLLNDEGTRRQSPLKIQEQLLLWRLGTDGISSEFWGLAGLFGDFSIGERLGLGLFKADGKSLDSTTVAAGIVNYVDRPLADSDLLNKRQTDNGFRTAKDDIPSRILVVADPAAGKSSMLERLDLIQARRARGSASESVPVRISLSSAENPTKEAIVSRIRDRLGAAADDAFRDRSLVVMIDALDEAVDPIAAARAIIAFSSEYQSEENNKVARIIVTSRLRNYTHSVHESDAALWRHDFCTVILYGLDQTSIEKQILSGSTPDVRQRLFKKLADSRYRGAWLQFLRLPLNFELVAEILAESDLDKLPEVQAQLVEKFIARRFKHRGISPSDADHCRSLLAIVASNRVAAGVQKRAQAFEVDDFRLPSEPSPIYQSIKPRIDQMLATGLIEEVNPGRYKFFHQNVLDYFIAKGLKDVAVVEPQLDDWREIIIFRSAMPGGKQLQDHLTSCKARGKKVDAALITEVARIVQRVAGLER